MMLKAKYAQAISDLCLKDIIDDGYHATIINTFQKPKKKHAIE